MHRPEARDFILYLSQEHYIMVWSSAQPVNVEGMCKRLFNGETSKRRIAVWNRQNFGLSANDYGQKVQVYKQLSKIWKHPELSRQEHGSEWIQFDQTNTVLLDDSREKAASEPFNLIEIETFEGRSDIRPDTLWQVRDYLDTLSSYTNVSAYIRENPYKYDPEHFSDSEAIPPSDGIKEKKEISEVLGGEVYQVAGDELSRVPGDESPRVPVDPPSEATTSAGNDITEPEQDGSSAPRAQSKQ
jgi:hypothetical protein